MPISVERNKEFSVLSLNRPDALNALNEATLRELHVAFEEVERTDSRALIITGTGGKAFCAGADVKELMGRTLKQQRNGIEYGQSVFRKLETLAIPSIAAIDGFAFGGGLELALACTFRIATEKSSLGLPEVKIGLIPGYGGTQRLPRLIGQSRALEMIMTGKSVSSTEALGLGLINRLVINNVIDESIKFAQNFSRHSLLTLQFAREAILRSTDYTIDQGLQAEADLISLAFQSKDSIEGMRAFIEKRKPTFTDQ